MYVRFQMNIPCGREYRPRIFQMDIPDGHPLWTSEMDFHMDISPHGFSRGISPTENSAGYVLHGLTTLIFLIDIRQGYPA